MAKTMESTISKTYAKALLDTALISNAYDVINSQLNQVVEVLETSSDLRIVMSNSSISTSKKLEILDEVFGGKVDVKVLNFLKILVEKGRFDELEAIKVSFNSMVDKLSNKKTVEVVSAVKLNFENKSNVLFKLEHKLNCEISPIWTVDKSLIAGLQIKYDDCVIDTSLRAKFESLSKNISR